MGCAKHSQRTRKDCPDCNKVGNIQPVVLKKKKISKEVVDNAVAKIAHEKEIVDTQKLEARYENKLENTVYKPSVPKLTSSEDVDREVRIEVSKIREYVDSVFSQALEKVKADINAIKAIRWEHIHIPLTIYRIDLMTAMANDGWKYCDMVKNPQQYGYSDHGDFVIVQRVVKPDNKPAPDFTKVGAVRKYLEKNL